MSASVIALISFLALAADELSVARSQIDAPPGLTFQAGYARHGSGTWVTEFYISGTDGSAPEWVVRKSLSTPDSREQAIWTTSGRCPVVIDVASSLGQLELGSLMVQGEADRPKLFVFPTPRGISTDGPSYTLWGKGMQGGGFASYRIDASSGTVADWGKAADEALNGCWSSASPEQP